MSKTKTHAENELDILINTTPDAIIRDFVPEIVAICEAFGKSGQSGGSAPYTARAIAQAIEKLCLHKTIAPLTGEDAEWSDRLGATDLSPVCQNIRNGAVFKENGKAYYLDAITWKTQRGSTWSGTAYLKNGQGITSRQFVKSFPFTPETFVIDVVEEEIAKDDWKFTVKNEDDLKEVFEYYNKYQ